MLKSYRSLLSITRGANFAFTNPAINLVGSTASSLDAKRYYRISQKRESALIVGGLSLLAAAVTAQYAHSFYLSLSNKNADEKVDGATDASAGETKNEEPQQAKKSEATSDAGSSSSPSGSTSTSWFARTFYEGGFEEKMSRREAALVLGVRESATPERIKDAHRRILLLNHPDRGGSAFIAAKINEAKDILMKGK